MPRRVVLSEGQRAALLALPTDEAVLVRYWTLSAEDLAVIVSRRRPHNRLGFAVQLCALRYPGRLLRPGELISAAPLAFVAEQLQVPPEVLVQYAMRGPTRYEQLDTLRDVFGFAPFSHPARAALQDWLLPVALTTTSGAELARMLVEEFRRRGIIVPGVSPVERMVGQGSFAGGGGELPLAWPSVFTGEVDVLPSEGETCGSRAGSGALPAAVRSVTS